MSETNAAEAEAIRRRYAMVFGEPIEGLRDLSVDMLQRLLDKADAQRAMYLDMGFEVDDPEDDAAVRCWRRPPSPPK